MAQVITLPDDVVVFYNKVMDDHDSISAQQGVNQHGRFAGTNDITLLNDEGENSVEEAVGEGDEENDEDKESNEDEDDENNDESTMKEVTEEVTEEIKE